MSHKTCSQIGLDRSLPHIGVIMEKFDTDTYLRYDLPENYSFSKYKPGYDTQWARLQYEVEQIDTLEEAEQAFNDVYLHGKSMDWLHRTNKPLERNMLKSTLFYEEMYKRMVFIVDDKDHVVGTGSVWGGNVFGEELQRLHWIAVSPEHQGKGLAKALMTKLLDLYNDLGYSGYIYLTSQTWSYRALHIYMQFGFKPYFGEKPVNWQAVNLVSGKYEPWDYKEKNIEAWNMIYDKICLYTHELMINNRG